MGASMAQTVNEARIELLRNLRDEALSEQQRFLAYLIEMALIELGETSSSLTGYTVGSIPDHGRSIAHAPA